MILYFSKDAKKFTQNLLIFFRYNGIMIVILKVDIYIRFLEGEQVSMFNEQVLQIAERIRGLRLILDIPVSEMAEVCSTTEEDYIAHENGEKDFSFTFLYNCAKHFGIDITELITGDKPKLSFYSVVRKGEGLPIKRRKDFNYQHLAAMIQDRISEPFLVTAKYDKDAEEREIGLSFHEGQEFDYILSGSLKVRLEDHVVVLHAGDSIFYDSGHGHGMIAVGGSDCEFLAVVMGKDNK